MLTTPIFYFKFMLSLYPPDMTWIFHFYKQNMTKRFVASTLKAIRLPGFHNGSSRKHLMNYPLAL